MADVQNLRQMEEAQRKGLMIKKYIAIGMDLYGASGPAALGIAAATAPLLGTGIGAAVPAALLSYAGFTEGFDYITGPVTGLYIYKTYGKAGEAGLEALLQGIPFATKLYPGVSMAHNSYLDDLREQGYFVPDDLYVAPQVRTFVEKAVNKVVNFFETFKKTNETKTDGQADQGYAPA
jgi:hypothetical protein